MNDTPIKTTTQLPVIIAEKGTLGDAARKAIRAAGYSLVEAKDTTKVKQFYPKSFNAASDRAKIKAFEHAMKQSCCTGDGLKTWYVHFLQLEKAF